MEAEDSGTFRGEVTLALLKGQTPTGRKLLKAVRKHLRLKYRIRLEQPKVVEEELGTFLISDANHAFRCSFSEAYKGRRLRYYVFELYLG